MPYFDFMGTLFSRKKSVIFVTLHKCATAFFARDVLSNLKGRTKVDYQILHYNNENLKIKVKKFGCIYGPLRILDENHPSCELTNLVLKEAQLKKCQIIFLVRDPRDILVSMYYSFGFSHGFSQNKEITDYQVKRRQTIQGMTIDEYAIYAAPGLKEKFAVISSLGRDARDKVLLKYEEMIDRFDDFYERLSDFVELNEGVRDKIFEQTRPRDREEPLHHKRKGKPGDYKVKLKEETLHQINAILKETLTDFGYGLEDNNEC